MEPVSLDQTWYVAFGEAGSHQPWYYRIFTRKGFEHVEAFAELPFKTVLYINSGLDGITPGMMFNEEDASLGFPVEAMACGYLAKGHKILRVKCSRGGPVMFHLANCIPSCVTLVKGLLGFKCWSVTPYGLYKALLKSGAYEWTEADAKEFYRKRVKELKMGGIMGKPDDGGAAAEAKKREQEAKEQARLEKEQESIKLNRTRRRQRGGGSLLRTQGQELGTSSKLGG
ncbi:MAG: hypothetical protein CMF62_06425 [Magnetococcales bacterium]|nr:hypothetical protein [Magnetococcales bacterium]|tara:strand:- start:313106 stop:313789 length:684 start_codon:yes stop_codon:yes gene_type:complete